MKKVLTVLLVIAVMFTFSFGSAFATTPDLVSDGYFTNLWADYVDTSVGGDTVNLKDTVDPSVSWNVDKSVAAGFEAEAKAAYDEATKDLATGYVTDATAFEDLLAADTDEAKAFRLAVAKAQFEADMADAIAKFATVPTYDYSTAVISKTHAQYAEAVTETGDNVKFVDKDYTYRQVAEKLVAYFTEKIEDLNDFNADVTVANYKKASEDAAKFVADNLYPVCVSVNSKVHSTGIYDLKVPYNDVTVPDSAPANGIVDDGTDAVDYVTADTVNTWSASAVASSEKTDAATVAAVKAMNAAKYAAAAVNASNAKLEYLDKWLKVADILAEEGYDYTTAGKTIADPDFSAETYAYRAEKMADLEDYAARYGAEKNADGDLVRDPAKVQKYLDEGIVQLATCADAQINTEYAAACENIYNAISETIAAKLDYAKASAKKAVELALADYADDYYAAEFDKIKGYADTCLAEVDAAESLEEVWEAVEKMQNKGAEVKNADALKAEWATSTAVDTLVDAAEAYVEYYNTKVADEEDADKLDATTLADRIYDMIGESGVRTNKEIKALKDEAVKVAQGLPTNDAVKAAKKALKNAVEALPTKATVADMALVQAVSDALDAYNDLTTAAHGVSMTAYTKAVGDIVAEYNKDFAQKYSKVSDTDEAAIKALKADIEAAIDTLEDLTGVDASTSYMDGLIDNLDEYLTKIRNNERKAVEDAIKAIPINVTEAEKDIVVKARELYDAYVEKYNDNTACYNDLFDEETKNQHEHMKDCLMLGYAAEDVDIRALTNAETVLGLNAPAPGADVQALKITAKSTAKKGSITVKWTVKGDATGIDGYQVWKSTKHSKGYKKAFTTTKQSYKNTKGLKAGTRYYYKVRAYKVVDGKNVYSDWSNKARRVAK